jgi:hypothetical protein
MAPHSTPGIFNAFSRSPNPILRHPISAIIILSAAGLFSRDVDSSEELLSPANPEVASSFEVLLKKWRRVDDIGKF